MPSDTGNIFVDKINSLAFEFKNSGRDLGKFAEWGMDWRSVASLLKVVERTNKSEKDLDKVLEQVSSWISEDKMPVRVNLNEEAKKAPFTVLEGVLSWYDEYQGKESLKESKGHEIMKDALYGDTDQIVVDTVGRVVAKLVDDHGWDENDGFNVVTDNYPPEEIQDFLNVFDGDIEAAADSLVDAITNPEYAEGPGLTLPLEKGASRRPKEEPKKPTIDQVEKTLLPRFGYDRDAAHAAAEDILRLFSEKVMKEAQRVSPEERDAVIDRATQLLINGLGWPATKATEFITKEFEPSLIMWDADDVAFAEAVLAQISKTRLTEKKHNYAATDYPAAPVDKVYKHDAKFFKNDIVCPGCAALLQDFLNQGGGSYMCPDCGHSMDGKEYKESLEKGTFAYEQALRTFQENQEYVKTTGGDSYTRKILEDYVANPEIE